MARRQPGRMRERLRGERGRLEKEVRGLIERNQVFRATEKRLNQLEKNLEKSFQTFLRNLNIPTRQEMKRLEKKIDKLGADLAKAQGKKMKAAAKKKKKTAKRKTAKKKASA